MKFNKDKIKSMLPGKEGHHQEAASDQQSQLHPNNPWYQPSQAQSHNAAAPEKYQPPPGPPPNQGSSFPSSSAYAPPPGPPPNYTTAHSSSSGYAPPSQPPPSWEPPPYHDWTQIPDNSLLPPPPSMGYESSPTANATADDGAYAYSWCKANPLWPPQNVDHQVYSMIQNYQLNLLKPPTYNGSLKPLQRAGHWKCSTDYANRSDSCLLTNLPIYSEMWDSPLRTQRPKTIYFEVKIIGFAKRHGWKSSSSEVQPVISIGFVAPPFPTWRLPGWQRGSLGVHGDDGHKYVNNTFGGAEFTKAFGVNDVVGIGIIFAPPKSPPAYGQPQEPKLDIEVFFTRNGSKEGGWDGNQELDAESEGGTIGLRGDCDLFPAVGVCGGLEFEVNFHPELWRYNPF